uniref:Uncharacterized protein n=3 Tax=Chaetoceros debilis TaxID=122233 RepID=A0A7S3VD87_9STRA
MIDCDALDALKESFARQDNDNDNDTSASSSRAENIIKALKSEGSDAVRKTLNGIGISKSNFIRQNQPLLNFFKDELPKLSNSADDEKAKAEYVCGVPFFCCEEKPEPKTKPKTPVIMSGNISGVERVRKCTLIENCIKHEVHFGHFDVNEPLDHHNDNVNAKMTTCETGTDRSSLVPVLKIDSNDEMIAESVANSLHSSFTRLDPGDNEEVQKKSILDSFKPILQLFGYNYKIQRHPDLHFQFIRDHNETSTLSSDSTSTSGGVILCGEAKAVANLPQKPMIAGSSAHLCRYGFRTAITMARNEYKYKDESLNQNVKKPRNPLTSSDTKTKLPTTVLDDDDDDENRNRTMPEMANQTLQFNDTPPNSQNQIGDTNTSTTSSSDIQIKMTESAQVKTQLQGGKVASKDRFNLWTATMQACEASLAQRMPYTVMMSARMMWFIKLDANENSNADAKCEKCTVLISAGILIGSNDFTQTLIRFIMLADDAKAGGGGVLDDSFFKNGISDVTDIDLSKQQESQTYDTSNNKRDRTSSSKDNSAETEGGSPKRKRRNKNDSSTATVHNLPLMTSKSSRRPVGTSTDNYNSSFSSPIKTVESPPHIQIMIQSADDHCFTNKIISPGPEAPDMGNTNTSGNVKSKSIDHTSTSNSNSNRMTDEEQMMWQRAFTGLGNANMKYLDQDQYGVIVPYLCQLEGAELESLGDGRCGTVKKISWNGSVAAMKEYVFQHEDDERVPSDVYEHEIKVFYRLEALWGRYVPPLLFRNPWSCRPSIGMEVGQPMSSDIDKWADEDKVKMNETIAAIENKGFRDRTI